MIARWKATAKTALPFTTALYQRVSRKLRYLAWTFSGHRAGDRFGFYKRWHLRNVGREFSCTTFVETGTHMGDTVDYVRRHFRKVISIELSKDLFDRSSQRFAKAANVTVLQGDSAVVLPVAMSYIEGRAIFWLDGHYSGPGTARSNKDCPVAGELKAIAVTRTGQDCILIDDARLFGTENDYPSLDAVKEMIRSISPFYRVFTANDIIHALPSDAAN